MKPNRPANGTIRTLLLVVLAGLLACTPEQSSPGASDFPGPASSPAGSESPGATSTPDELHDDLARPVLIYAGRRNVRRDGLRMTAYELNVANWQVYPAELFEPLPEAADCPESDWASRLAVRLTDETTGAELASGCALASAAELASLEFVLARDAEPPVTVILEVSDRLTGQSVRSHAVAVRGDARPPAGTPGAASPSPTGPPATPSSTGQAPSPGQQGWSDERVSQRFYQQVSLAIDDGGVAHAAAYEDQVVYYLTNASGSWTRRPLATPLSSGGFTGFDSEPSIALDSDGSVWIAFTRWAPCGTGCPPRPAGIYFVTNRSGSWSEPRQLTGEETSNPDLRVRDRRIHLAFTEGFFYWPQEDPVDVRVRYLEGRPNDLASPVDVGVQSLFAAQNDLGPSLGLAPDGSPRILAAEGPLGDMTLRYAVGGASGFSSQAVPRRAHELGDPVVAIDPRGTSHAVWSGTGAGEDMTVQYSRLESGGWRQEETALRGAPVVGAARLALDVDGRGSAHLIAQLYGDGVWYATNRSGGFESRRLSAQWGDSVAVALDRDGRPHVLYLVSDYDANGNPTTSELWYAVGPAS